jgi:hypothetical protein
MNVSPVGTNRLVYTFGIGGFILMLFMLSMATAGCKGSPPPVEDTTKLVSEDFNVPEVVDTPVVEEEPKKPKRSRRSKGGNSNYSGGSKRSGGGGKSADQLKTDQPRNGDSAIDFARAVQWRVIGMLYKEPCQIVSVKVLDEKVNEEGLKEIRVEIQWKDKWIRKPYLLEGRLTVASDGSGAVFKILSKNLEAEALEVGLEEFKETLDLGNI